MPNHLFSFPALSANDFGSPRIVVLLLDVPSGTTALSGTSLADEAALADEDAFCPYPRLECDGHELVLEHLFASARFKPCAKPRQKVW